MLLALYTTGITGQLSISAYHAMTRHDDPHGIAPVRAAHGTRRACGHTHPAREIAVGPGGAERDLLQRRPYTLLELGAIEPQRYGKHAALTGEVLGDLFHRRHDCT